MKKTVQLRSGRVIGQGHPCFIVAEVGNNHQGKLEIALEMVREAARCGVDAVKFQKRDVNSLLTKEGRNALYLGKNSFGRTYGEHRKALELSVEEMAQVKELADELGLIFFASAWDRVSLAQMESLGVELVKISSADMTCVPLLRQAASLNVPIIMSTGMSGYAEIGVALSTLRAIHDNIIILHCNSTYPCPEEHIGLPVMERLRELYKLPVGYSGHEQGLGPSVAAAALGACVVERHFTLGKDMQGTDHRASLEPQEMAALVRMVRETEKALMVSDKLIFPSEEVSSRKLRKSIVFARDLPAGHTLAAADLTVRCPGTGISPVHWDDVVGATLMTQVRYEEQFSWNMILSEREAWASSPSKKSVSLL